MSTYIIYINEICILHKSQKLAKRSLEPRGNQSDLCFNLLKIIILHTLSLNLLTSLLDQFVGI